MSMLLLKTPFPVDHRDAVIRQATSRPDLVQNTAYMINRSGVYGDTHAPTYGYNLYRPELGIPRLDELVEENHVIGVVTATQASLNWTAEKANLLGQMELLWERHGWPGDYRDMRAQYRNTWQYVRDLRVLPTWFRDGTAPPLIALTWPHYARPHLKNLYAVGGLHKLERA